jgi:hypothetical protein
MKTKIADLQKLLEIPDVTWIGRVVIDHQKFKYTSNWGPTVMYFIQNQQENEN